jgi:uncharacterized membrane protein YgdD (TMEM256/DUF423 family)
MVIVTETSMDDIVRCAADTMKTIGAAMERKVFGFGAVLVGLGVAFGAFGAHALKAMVSPQYLATFETGVRYQMYHGLGLLALAWAIGRWPERRLSLAAWLLVIGTVVFSGSLYALVLTGQRWLGAITPLGGMALIAGWLLVAWRLLTSGGEVEQESV